MDAPPEPVTNQFSAEPAEDESITGTNGRTECIPAFFGDNVHVPISTFSTSGNVFMDEPEVADGIFTLQLIPKLEEQQFRAWIASHRNASRRSGGEAAVLQYLESTSVKRSPIERKIGTFSRNHPWASPNDREILRYDSKGIERHKDSALVLACESALLPILSSCTTRDVFPVSLSVYTRNEYEDRSSRDACNIENQIETEEKEGPTSHSEESTREEDDEEEESDNSGEEDASEPSERSNVDRNIGISFIADSPYPELAGTQTHRGFMVFHMRGGTYVSRFGWNLHRDEFKDRPMNASDLAHCMATTHEYYFDGVFDPSDLPHLLFYVQQHEPNNLALKRAVAELFPCVRKRCERISFYDDSVYSESKSVGKACSHLTLRLKRFFYSSIGISPPSHLEWKVDASRRRLFAPISSIFVPGHGVASVKHHTTFVEVAVDEVYSIPDMDGKTWGETVVVSFVRYLPVTTEFPIPLCRLSIPVDENAPKNIQKHIVPIAWLLYKTTYTESVYREAYREELERTKELHATSEGKKLIQSLLSNGHNWTHEKEVAWNSCIRNDVNQFVASAWEIGPASEDASNMWNRLQQNINNVRAKHGAAVTELWQHYGLTRKRDFLNPASRIHAIQDMMEGNKQVFETRISCINKGLVSSAIGWSGRPARAYTPMQLYIQRMCVQIDRAIREARQQETLSEESGGLIGPHSNPGSLYKERLLGINDTDAPEHIIDRIRGKIPSRKRNAPHTTEVHERTDGSQHISSPVRDYQNVVGLGGGERTDAEVYCEKAQRKEMSRGHRKLWEEPRRSLHNQARRVLDVSSLPGFIYMDLLAAKIGPEKASEKRLQHIEKAKQIAKSGSDVRSQIEELLLENPNICREEAFSVIKLFRKKKHETKHEKTPSTLVSECKDDSVADPRYEAVTDKNTRAAMPSVKKRFQNLRVFPRHRNDNKSAVRELYKFYCSPSTHIRSRDIREIATLAFFALDPREKAVVLGVFHLVNRDTSLLRKSVLYQAASSPHIAGRNTTNLSISRRMFKLTGNFVKSIRMRNELGAYIFSSLVNAENCVADSLDVSVHLLRVIPFGEILFRGYTPDLIEEFHVFTKDNSGSRKRGRPQNSNDDDLSDLEHESDEQELENVDKEEDLPPTEKRSKSLFGKKSTFSGGTQYVCIQSNSVSLTDWKSDLDVQIQKMSKSLKQAKCELERNKMCSKLSDETSRAATHEKEREVNNLEMLLRGLHKERQKAVGLIDQYRVLCKDAEREAQIMDTPLVNIQPKERETYESLKTKYKRLLEIIKVKEKKRIEATYLEAVEIQHMIDREGIENPTEEQIRAKRSEVRTRFAANKVYHRLKYYGLNSIHLSNALKRARRNEITDYDRNSLRQLGETGHQVYGESRIRNCKLFEKARELRDTLRDTSNFTRVPSKRPRKAKGTRK